MSRVDFHNGLRMVLFNVPATNAIHLTLQLNEAPPDNVTPVFSTTGVFYDNMSIADIVFELTAMLAEIINTNAYLISATKSSASTAKEEVVEVLNEALARSAFFMELAKPHDSPNT